MSASVKDLKHVALSAANAYYAGKPVGKPGIIFPIRGLYLGDVPAEVTCHYAADATGVPVFTWSAGGHPATEATIARIIAHTQRREAERAAPECEGGECN